ncbi:MAG: TlpA family protein disulfide reductase [Bacteroidaceae bacterium]|nr:TlpA family protein disulfide reductase [Bacteroidaceae bacterium]
MKRTIIAILLSLIAVAGNAKNKAIVWEETSMVFTSNRYFQIKKVELTKQETKLYARYYYMPSYWFSIAKGSYLQSGGKTYPIVSADSITLGERFTLGDKGEQEFVLHFEPLPMKTKEFDFIEGLKDNNFKVFGVHDKNVPLPATPVPAEYRADYTEEDLLPELQYGSEPATIRFKTINLRKGMKQEIKMRYIDLKNLNLNTPTRETTKVLHLDEAGEAEISLPLGFPQDVNIELSSGYWFSTGHLFLAPGKEVTVLIDMMRDDTERKDRKFVGFNGYMAKLDKEFSEAFKDSQKGCEYTFPKQTDIKDMPSLVNYLEGRKAHMEGWKKSAPFMEITKEVLQQKVNMPIFMSTPELDSLTKTETFRDYLLRQHREPLQNSKRFLDDYFVYASRYYAMDKEARGINADLARYCYYLPKVLDGQKVEKPLIEDKSLSALYDQAVEEYRKTIAANQKELADNVHYLDMTDVAPENILQTILDEYKGKAVLIDLWATWCGPCRKGHKDMAPLKEQLKGKNIQFVYITSTSSPYEDWKPMLGDISGNHYYLTKGQWDHLLELYQSNGIPTYAIYDADGKLTYSTVGFPGIDKIKEEIEKVLK